MYICSWPAESKMSKSPNLPRSLGPVGTRLKPVLTYSPGRLTELDSFKKTMTFSFKSSVKGLGDIFKLIKG